MSNKPDDPDPPHGDDDNVADMTESDVTEILPASEPKADDGGSEVTQILPMRSPAQPKQELPGTVIGVVGAQPTAAQNATDADPLMADDDAATKILFETPSRAGELEHAVADRQPTADPDQKPEQADDTVSHVDATTPGSSNARQIDPEQNNETTVSKPKSAEPADAPMQDAEKTVFLTPVSKSNRNDDFNPPVGWLVIVDGPGRGHVVDISYGQNTIGRGRDQNICLDFGDTQITRDTHAYLLYDELERTFFLRDAGKKNIVRINKTPVMTPTQINSHDQIQIGQTTCLFVPLCNDVFDWLGGEDDPSTGPAEEGNSE